MKQKKYYFNGLYLELTRECNLRCAHCLCGEPQDVTITREIFDKFLSQTQGISHLMIGGGEPLLKLDLFEYLFNALERHGVFVAVISFVTNGTVLDARVTNLINEYLSRNPSCNAFIDVSHDMFHDALRSERCLDFYKKLASERCHVNFHVDIDYLHHSGRAWGKRSVQGIPVVGSMDTDFRPHIVKIVNGRVYCSMCLSANGNLGFQAVTSFDVRDKLALGNVLSESLEVIFDKNRKTCPYLCDECFSEMALKNYEDFRFNRYSLDDNIKLYRFRISRKHLELTWALREWAFKALPQVDTRGIIMGTIIDDKQFFEDALLFISKAYCALSDNAEVKKLFDSAEMAQAYFLSISREQHIKNLKKRFPTSELEKLHELSTLTTIYGALNHMGVDEYKLMLFKGHLAEDYFKTIVQRLKKHGMNIHDFNACAKIPDTLDKDDRENEDDANKVDELQQDAAG